MGSPIGKRPGLARGGSVPMEAGTQVYALLPVVCTGGNASLAVDEVDISDKLIPPSSKIPSPSEPPPDAQAHGQESAGTTPLAQQ